MSASPLWSRYLHLKTEEPKIRARDAAQRLGVSEAELVEADPLCQPLRAEWAELLAEVAKLGPVMALTRNEAAVHEKTGVYDNVSFNGHVGLALNRDIDLRIFLKDWQYGFALRGERPSLQFFDGAGEAVHKIFLTDKSLPAEYEALVARFGASAATAIAPQPLPATPAEQPDAAIDAAAFGEGWLNLQDTHDFFPLMRRFSVSRAQALRLAPQGMVREVGLNAVAHMLEQAAQSQLAIMAFVGNRGCIQIHTGPVERIVPMGPWLNVLDPGFNLHLRMDLFERAFVVRKPTRDGEVTSLECYDAAGELIVQFFGERKPGQHELPSWTRLAHSLPGEELLHAA